jgi:hypothetical protein
MSGFRTAVGLAVALGGCGISDPAELLDARILLSDSLVASSAPIEVRVEATNRSSTTVQVDSNGCPHVFRVEDDDGDIVGPPSPICAAVYVPPTTLLPGESISFTYQWSGDDLAHADLPAGEYRLRGWVLHPRLGRAYSDEVSVTVVVASAIADDAVS